MGMDWSLRHQPYYATALCSLTPSTSRSLSTTAAPASFGNPAASVRKSSASISFSSSYRLPTSCREIGASVYVPGLSANNRQHDPRSCEQWQTYKAHD